MNYELLLTGTAGKRASLGLLGTKGSIRDSLRYDIGNDGSQLFFVERYGEVQILILKERITQNGSLPMILYPTCRNPGATALCLQ